MFLKGHGRAKKKFVGEVFNVVGDVGEGKNCEGVEKSFESSRNPWGSLSWGLLQRGVLLVNISSEKTKRILYYEFLEIVREDKIS